MDSPAPKKFAWQLWVRLIFFLIIFAYMALGPIPRQVLGIRNPYFPKWRMFKGKGVGLMDVKFYQRLPDGKDVLLDRFEILRIPGSRKGNTSVWRMRGIQSIYEVGNRICRRMGPETDLRVMARRAGRTGWEVKFNKEVNICGSKKRSRFRQKKAR